ncbi:DegT/DnrJ/EryC1/StrS family aminotransferase [Parabacteroides sp. PF5-6]|uniref:DegT/DnrJ/EryC1/StrS family aminotransferase n=1 Tax=Parabacteroides sp. PF5-6 TaxID=1742403 RepID=UPI00240714A5|nr:DegT/DnrJ/EryC1/StrS family aminotransferase [Parabacteroides sp. PF5-6]MDF9830948.1 UDP-2-acetamido-2-deoxy-ribo-hexuluronate aminotransferase [Parabacteroides sp. PF5-6]
MIEKIQMVDLHSQYLRLKPEIDQAMQAVIDSTAFINGPQVKTFATQLSEYLSVPHLIPCGNGTDALQIALMALDLKPGDEVIVPAFTYIAAVEVIALLGLTPVLVDVYAETFNLNEALIEQAITERTRAIIVVHLFGQCVAMEPILKLAKKYRLYVVEDNAQSIGATCQTTGETVKNAGTIGHIGTTSFFPSKPLACYGDGGAMMTSDPVLAGKMQKMANHGQEQGRKYHHQLVGCNSRLDTLQAAILLVKLKYLDEFTAHRQAVAQRYDEGLRHLPFLSLPAKAPHSTHVYHQYTLRVAEGKRDELKRWLQENGIPSMVYYPFTVQEQQAFKMLARIPQPIPVATSLCRSVLSIPIHTEMTPDETDYIIETICRYA